ncbi:hypothetical protein ACWFR1_33870 [Streptomyces sp. NPDC055103]
MREELFGEVEFVVGLVGVEEGDGEGAQGLVVGGFAGFCVLFGFEAPCQVGRRPCVPALPGATTAEAVRGYSSVGGAAGS